MVQQPMRSGFVWEEDPFSGLREVPLPLHARMSPERMLAYAQALEGRRNMLWAYLQGHEVTNDPVVHLLAETFEVVEASVPADTSLDSGSGE